MFAPRVTRVAGPWRDLSRGGGQKFGGGTRTAAIG